MPPEAKNDALTVNILIKREEGMFVAHCLEMDIVATGDSLEAVKSDIIDLIKAQITFAFAHGNQDNLFHPAPSEVWREFYKCSGVEKARHEVPQSEDAPGEFIPPWFFANTCGVGGECGV